MVLYSLTNGSKITRRNGAISLEAPFFISAAEAAEGSESAKAFPEDKAGIAAYVKVSSIDIEKIKSIFPEVETEIEKVGDNYTIGTIPISNFGGDIDVHLYADTDGWLVAYLEKDEWASKIMQWEITDPKEPDIGVISTTTLEDALHKAGDVSGVGISPDDIKYYNFEFPDANGITLFVKTVERDDTNIVKMEIPATYTLYEASYYHYAWVFYDNWHVSSKLKIDEKTVSDLSNSERSYFVRAFGSYEETITTGMLHKIDISENSDKTSSAGVATVLIYKAE